MEQSRDLGQRSRHYGFKSLYFRQCSQNKNVDKRSIVYKSVLSGAAWYLLTLQGGVVLHKRHSIYQLAVFRSQEQMLFLKKVFRFVVV